MGYLANLTVVTALVDTGRGFIFDTGLAPPCAGAALAALEVFAAEPGLGARARAAATRLAAIAAEEDLRVSAPDAAVLAVTVGESARAVLAKETCAAYGVRVGCFRPPSVPRGQACLRLTGRASLTEDHFAAAARALAAVRDDEDQGGRRWVGWELPVRHWRVRVPGVGIPRVYAFSQAVQGRHTLMSSEGYGTANFCFPAQMRRRGAHGLRGIGRPPETARSRPRRDTRRTRLRPLKVRH